MEWLSRGATLFHYGISIYAYFLYNEAALAFV
jgi:hypothetical protein